MSDPHNPRPETGIELFDHRISRGTLLRGAAGTMDVPYFEVGGADVWGATAMVLSELLAAIDGLA